MSKKRISVPVEFSPGFTAAMIYRQTMEQLERYRHLVKEGKSLEEALSFSRFIFWSSIPDLCEAYASKDETFPCDGKKMRKQVSDLQVKVREWFLKTRTSPEVELAELQCINQKLDILLRASLGESHGEVIQLFRSENLHNS